MAKRPATTTTGTHGREALFKTFDGDIASMVYEWDAADPRSQTDRRQALFKFMYEGYNSSAWVPQSVFDANRILQLVVGDADTIVRDRIGLVLWPQNQTAKAYGMAPNPAPGRPLSWTLNCVACHMAEIDGIAYFGVGNKTLDEKMLGDTVERVTEMQRHRLLRGGSVDHAAAVQANEILKRHHHETFDPLTRGRSTAFPASHVEMYMRANNGVMPSLGEVGRGDVKIPPLSHTAAKMPFGRWYCDGSFQGEFPLMASSMELALDQSFDKLVTSVLPTIKDDFKNVIQHIRPPRYPHAIDPILAAKGKTLFNSDKIGCYKCHGTYDGRGNVEWTGVHADVGTDRARLQLVTDSFVAAFDRSPLAAEGKLAVSEGYAATPLTGVWANFPYLHNGSVPTLYDLLGPEAERPRIFSVMAARKLDPVRVGQRLLPEGQDKKHDEAELLRKCGNDRAWFNTERAGCGNRGHNFWPRIETEDNRLALIEYLKTL